MLGWLVDGGILGDVAQGVDDGRGPGDAAGVDGFRGNVAGDDCLLVDRRDVPQDTLFVLRR